MRQFGRGNCSCNDVAGIWAALHYVGVPRSPKVGLSPIIVKKKIQNPLDAETSCKEPTRRSFARGGGQFFDPGVAAMRGDAAGISSEAAPGFAGGVNDAVVERQDK